MCCISTRTSCRRARVLVADAVQRPAGVHSQPDPALRRRSRDRLRYNRDGSLDIYIQHERPAGAKAANWLPAPPDGLNMMLRAYWPEQVLLDGTWMPPAVMRVN